MASRSEDLYPEIMESGERERNIGKSNEFKRLLLKFLAIYWRSFVVVLWPIILLPLLITESEKPLAMRCFYIVGLMAMFWVTEVLPLPITGMIPVVLYPLMGIMSTNETCLCYMNDTTMMFLGSLVIAVVIENSGLHMRMALFIIKTIGCSHRRLTLGLFFVTMFISMWISNTAATAMMIPIMETVLVELETQGLGNMFVHKEEAAEENSEETRFPNSHGINFASWMLYSVPPMLLMGLLTWLWLQVMYMGLFRPESKDARAIDIGQQGERIAAAVIEKRYKELGPVSWHESSVGVLFIFVVLLWFFRSPGFMPGWAAYISNVSIKDSTAAACVTILFFMIPSKLDFLYAFSKDPRKRPTKPSLGLITWKMINDKLHWSLIFVLGGGFAISEGSTTSGLSEMLGQYLIGLKKINIVAILLIVCFFAENVTELTANVAVANIILPVLAEMCVAIKIHPLYLMLPAALCCSFSFHLPVGTPPNAIASAAGHIKTKDFMIAGIGPSIITLVVTAVAFSTWGTYVFNLSEFPEWAT
ncbi:protein I'm not dead yet isoform X2 [Monomorium pharaonis]|uniref:protein I'm not dead yet isoform X2 n=1 Tax=Monomorium pharaonis TaxID=307658 RepID=UPI0017479525|nr:protein I'm not dead yet isoform X2 [Monomorium pharaonis]